MNNIRNYQIKQIKKIIINHNQNKMNQILNIMNHSQNTIIKINSVKIQMLIKEFKIQFKKVK